VTSPLWRRMSTTLPLQYTRRDGMPWKSALAPVSHKILTAVERRHWKNTRRSNSSASLSESEHCLSQFGLPPSFGTCSPWHLASSHSQSGLNGGKHGCSTLGAKCAIYASLRHENSASSAASTSPDRGDCASNITSACHPNEKCLKPRVRTPRRLEVK
jgi:hypothetical protein